jgi:hypothetical protein
MLVVAAIALLAPWLILLGATAYLAYRLEKEGPGHRNAVVVMLYGSSEVLCGVTLPVVAAYVVYMQGLSWLVAFVAVVATWHLGKYLAGRLMVRVAIVVHHMLSKKTTAA